MLKECCDIALSSLEGGYGWLNELLAIILFVIFFNFFVKWVLKKLHLRFQNQGKIWLDGFFQALYLPLSVYVWFFAAIHTIDLIVHKIFPATITHLREMHLLFAVTGILCLAWFVMRWKKRVMALTILKSNRLEINMDAGKIGAIDKLATIFILFTTIILIMEATNININTLIAFGGIGGLGIAFASQEIIANFFGGFMIYVTHPFTVGDWISLPERNIEGHVEEIGWYMTRIKTFEKRPIYIPNSMFTKAILMNPSRMSHRQFKETISLRLQDLPLIRTLLEEISQMLKMHPNIDSNQKILVHFKGISSSSLDILISAYSYTIDAANFGDVKQDLWFKIIEIISKHGAKIDKAITSIDIPGGVVLKEAEE